MTQREERLVRLEAMAERRRRRRNTNWHIACGFNRMERALWWLQLAREADRLEARLWQARVAAGVRRWAVDGANHALRALPPVP